MGSVSIVNGRSATPDWSLFRCMAAYTTSDVPQTYRGEHSIGTFNFTVTRLTQSTSVKSSANTMQRHYTRRQVSQPPTRSHFFNGQTLASGRQLVAFFRINKPKVLFAITLVKLMRFAIQRKSVLSLIAESISHPTVKEEAVITLPIAIRDKLEAWFTKSGIQLLAATIRYARLI